MGQQKEELHKGLAYHTYQLLHFAFLISPIVAGTDKFFNFFTNVIIAGIGVWRVPELFAYVVVLGLFLSALALRRLNQICSALKAEPQRV